MIIKRRGKKRNLKEKIIYFGKILILPAITAVIGGYISYGFSLKRMKREKAEIQDVSVYIGYKDVGNCFEGSKTVSYNRNEWRLIEGEVRVRNTGYADLSNIPIKCYISGYITGVPKAILLPSKLKIEGIIIKKNGEGQRIELNLAAFKRNEEMLMIFFYFIPKKGENNPLPSVNIEKAGIRVRNLKKIYSKI